MSPLRLVLITRRYWPLVGGAEIVMANLASEFQRLGHSVTLLTARWEESWPVEVTHREVRVIRLHQPKRRIWGTWRYIVNLGRWLSHHQGSYDGVLVSMLKHDAFAALRHSQAPVVLRAEGGGKSGDCQWQARARLGPRIRRVCQQAPAVIAPSTSVAQELSTAGYPRITEIPNGVEIPTQRLSRDEARAALTGIHADLETTTHTPVVVYTGRLDEGKGLLDLVRAWSFVREQMPDARLWLIGEGPQRDELFQEIKDAEQRGWILLPGRFDDVSDVLSAADAFVLPSYAEGLSLSMLEAMAYRVPVVATRIPGNQQIVADDSTGLLVETRQPRQLADAVLQTLRDRVAAERRAAAAYEQVCRHFSLANMAARHLDVIQSAILQRGGS